MVSLDLESVGCSVIFISKSPRWFLKPNALSSSLILQDITNKHGAAKSKQVKTSKHLSEKTVVTRSSSKIEGSKALSQRASSSATLLIPTQKPSTDVALQIQDPFKLGKPKTISQRTTLASNPEKETCSVGYKTSSSSLQKRSKPIQKKHVVDIDQFDHSDPLAATEYVMDIYEELRKKEDTVMVSPTYMKEIQPFIKPTMRSILVDWLIAAHGEFKLADETLYLTASLLDRFLAKAAVTQTELQLAGLTALWIASKYVETYHVPYLAELKHICNHCYSSEDFVAAEEHILKTLDYQVTVPTADKFMSRYLKAANADETMTNVASYILDGTLLSCNLLAYRPSELAAAAVMISNKETSGRVMWGATMEYYSGYTSSHVKAVANAVMEEKGNAIDCLQALDRKYAHDKYGAVSILYFQS